ncbi:hypothetical protein CspHIS471_0602730 [Cutaneotrichosporon sp. HIS471]|nr:hypothetical protein CspHIS471_0602730 [Cutaneotrichosporon sp. HIS471]
MSYDWMNPAWAPEPPAKEVDYSLSPAFHLILRYLSVRELLDAECVSKRWKATIQSDGGVWRAHAEERIDADVIAATSELVHRESEDAATKGEKTKVTLWRTLCRDHIHALDTWNRSTPSQRGVDLQATAYAELPTLGAIVALDRDKVAFMCDSSLNTLHSFETAFTAIKSVQGYFIALRSSNGLGQHPLPPPTTLEVYRAAQEPARPGDIPAPGGRLELVRRLGVDGMWGFNLHVSEDEEGVVIAMLGTPARLTQRTPDRHWRAGLGPLEVHVWHLKDGTREACHVVPVPQAGRRVQSFCVAGNFVAIPDDFHLHIYKMGGEYVRIPLTPLGASLAGIINTHDRPYSHVMGNEVATPNMAPAERPHTEMWETAHQVINWAGNAHTRPTIVATRSHLIYTSECGALGIIYDYEEAFHILFKIPAFPEQMRIQAEAVSEYTVMFGAWPGMVSLEACGERIACTTRNGSAFTFDAADIPEPRYRFTEYPLEDVLAWRSWVFDMGSDWRHLPDAEGLRIARIHKRGLSLVPGSMMRHSLALSATRRSVMAFILLLLTTLSALTIPEIALLRLEQHGEWVADLGVFGLCFNNDTRTHCTRASVGYTLPFVHVAGMSLSAALVVNPVAAGLVGLAMVPRAYFMIIVAAVLAVLALSFNLAFVMPILLIALILSRRPGPITDEEASAGSVMSDTTVAGDETKPVHEAESQVRVHRLL